MMTDEMVYGLYLVGGWKVDGAFAMRAVVYFFELRICIRGHVTTWGRNSAGHDLVPL